MESTTTSTQNAMSLDQFLQFVGEALKACGVNDPSGLVSGLMVIILIIIAGGICWILLNLFGRTARTGRF